MSGGRGRAEGGAGGGAGALGSCRRFVRDAAGVFDAAPLGLERAEEPLMIHKAYCKHGTLRCNGLK